MVDGTGAGDAMAAGLAAHMTTHGPARHWTIENLRDAMGPLARTVPVRVKRVRSEDLGQTSNRGEF